MIYGKTLGSIWLLACEKTAKKHKEQPESDKREAEGGEKTHACHQRFQGCGNALGD